MEELWKPGYLRLFLSHKDGYKKQAVQFKEAMDLYGGSCFVAHEDIEPTREWQNEIKKALFSMDVLIALMTEDFSNSNWTDQEVGVAIGRKVTIVSVNLGLVPYGFIGKFQALPGAQKDVKTLAKKVYGLLWSIPALKARLTESLVTRFEASESFAHADILMGYLEKIENAPPAIIDRLEKAPKKNSQVHDSFCVQKKLPPLIKSLRKGRSSVS